MISFSFFLFFWMYSGTSEPKFDPQVIDENVAIGYGVVTGDVDGDGKVDLILADKKQFVWYRNGDWKRFILTENLTERDNVCIAARDLDGDGKVEIAVGAQWNPGETSDENQSGSVHYLIRPADPTQLWAPVQLPHEPTVHRMYWVNPDGNSPQLIVLPLHGRGNQGGEGAGVKVLAYEFPNDPESEWKTQLIDESMHLTHNMTLNQVDGREEILIGGKEGIKAFVFKNGKWNPSKKKPHLVNEYSFGELSVADEDTNSWLLAGIEPLHGNQATVYFDPSGKGNMDNLSRTVLDENLKEGHGVLARDFLGNGTVQIVAGWRVPNEAGEMGIKIYVPRDESYSVFDSFWIDQNDMAMESLATADLNGDGKLDLVASGRATNNLKIYWNRN